MINEINDVVFFTVLVGGANNTDGFIESEVNEIVRRRLGGLVVYGNFISRQDFRAHFRHFAIDANASFFNEFIGGTPRTKTDFAQVFIDAYC